MRQEQLFVLKNKVINYDLPFALCCLHIEKGVWNIFLASFLTLNLQERKMLF